MKRLPGIVISAVVLVLGSLFQLLMAGLMAMSGLVTRSHLNSGGSAAASPASTFPEWMAIFTFVLSGIFVLLAAWGITTAVGLFKLWRWSRYSVLVIGGLLAVICLPAALMSLAFMFVPMPGLPTVDASQAATVHTLTKMIFGGVAFGYGLTGGIGVWWMVYFSRKKVRESFASGANLAPEGPRPLLISIIAVLLLFGAATCVVLAFLPLPAVFFGFLVNGWGKAAACFTYAILTAIAGTGLWRLQEWGRRLALALQALGVVQEIVCLARPAQLMQYMQEINRTLLAGMPQQQLQAQSAPYNQFAFYGATFGSGILMLLIVAGILHYYRGAFRPPATPPELTHAPLA